MNFLNINSTDNLGGHKRSNNDLYYIQQSVYDVCEALAITLGNTTSPLVLGDFALTDGATTFTLAFDAIVYYNRKLYRVSAATGVTKSVAAGAAYKFRIDTTLGLQNPVTYGSGAQKNVHLYEYMTLVHTELTGTNYVPLATMNVGTWIPYTPVLGSGFSAVTTSGYYKVIGKTMHLRISVTAMNDDEGAKTVLLPGVYKCKHTARRMPGIGEYIYLPPAAETGYEIGGTDYLFRLATIAGSNAITAVGVKIMTKGQVFELDATLTFEIE